MAHRLDPAIRLAWLGAGALVTLVPIVLTVVVVVADLPPVAVIGGVAVSCLVALVALGSPFLRYRRWSYELRPRDLVVVHGVVVRTERWIPRTRVQYVDLSSGPIDRLLGLRSLVVYTAGSGLRAVTIPGLPAERAEDLRSELVVAGGTDAADESPA